MDDKEYGNVYAIPANYTDSGKLLGGMLEVRNAIEAALVILVVGYPELMWMHISGTMKAIIMTVTLLPLGVVAIMGVAGDSLFQYLGHIIRHWIRRRKLHYRRIGYKYEPTNAKGAGRKKRAKPQKNSDR